MMTRCCAAAWCRMWTGPGTGLRWLHKLQMGRKPFASTMCNEGELLEKFNIQLSPIPMTELVQAVRDAQADEHPPR